jgi:glutamate-ammonia-ligase adenylyltransferase
MPASVELLSILRSNADVRELFADVLGSAPRLAQVVATRPHVLDAAIDPGRARRFEDRIDDTAMAARVAEFVAPALSFEDALDRARDFAAEEMFLIGVRLLSGGLDPDRAGRAYSALAQGIVAAMLERVSSVFAADHGAVSGGRVAVAALGKAGSREMTAASDLDLMLIYDFPDEALDSSGARPLAPAVYYTRLTQRLLGALTAPTKAGKLYDVDMRLRPSGRKGPLATQFSAFKIYQLEEAETWEHMALTRARVIAGDGELASEIAAIVRATLTRKRDPARIARDVLGMRALIAKEKGDADPWDLKLVAGGLLDIEFAAQYLVVAFAQRHPEIVDVSTRAILEKACAAGLVAMSRARTLVDAHRLFTDATQFMRLAISGRFEPAAAVAGVKRRIAAATGFPDFSAFEAAIGEARTQVREAFGAIVKA